MIFSNIDIFKFRSTDYIFEVTPDPQSDYLYLAIIYGLLILLSIGFWIVYSKRHKEEKIWQKMRGRVFNFFFYTGVIGLVLIFARFQQIAYLGSRLFSLILWLIMFFWLIYILNYRYRVFAKELIKIEKKKKFEKYLPIKNKWRNR